MDEPPASNAELVIARPLRPAAGLAPAFLEGEFRELPPQRLRDQLRILWKHRWLAAACFLACLAAAVLVTLLTTRSYTASARIQIARSSPIKLQLKDDVVDLEEAERILNGASSFIATQVQTLRSRDVAERAIRDARLAEEPAFADAAPRGAASAAVALPLPQFLQPRGLNEAAGTEIPPAPADTAPVDPILLDRYMDYLAVEDVRGTDLLEVRFTAPDPVLAARLAAAHVQAYLAFTKDSQMATDSTAKVFLAAQLSEARAGVDRASAALADFAAAHPDVAVNQEDQLVGKQIGELSGLLSEAAGRRATAQSRYEFLAKAKRGPLPKILDENAAIAKLRSALFDVQAREASLKERLGPNHSRMRDLRREETELRLQLDGEVDLEIAAARARFTEAKLHEDELGRRLAEEERRATELRTLGGQYDILKNELETGRSLHDSLLKQKTDTAVRAELAASNVRVIERPEVPRVPAKPRAKTNLLVGALAGVVLALGAVFFRESLDHSVKSSAEAEGLLQLPTLAIIPNFALAPPFAVRRLTSRRGREAVRQAGRGEADWSGPAALVALRHPWSPVAEAFRILRTGLSFSTSGASAQVIVVTSAAAGEGKTVTALNLASTMADAGRRVLLIDADLRHPGCHEALGVDVRPGLSDYLTGQVDLDEVVRELAAPRLAFIAAGARPPNPADLLGSARMRDALDRLRRFYDIIVLDTPPVLPVTDAVLLARAADGVLLVMKGLAAPRELVRRARDQLQLAGTHLLGVVVNNVDRSWGDSRFYDGYPHYHATGPLGGAPLGVGVTDA